MISLIESRFFLLCIIFWHTNETVINQVIFGKQSFKLLAEKKILTICAKFIITKFQGFILFVDQFLPCIFVNFTVLEKAVIFSTED